ncbi:MAG: polysaccharide deacetylase family protein [Bacilli bacterium]|nr:polysaccharide deacetylase family protein [Bacilli bacterium]
MKYFVFSIDDGTIYDKTTIDLFNKYGIKGTFNLNSGLQDFVWYLGELPIRRLDLYQSRDLYNGHEVASHTLTHPYLDQCPDEIVIKEVNEDIYNLETIFDDEITSFATPFETCGDREVNLIQYGTKITNIRLSEIDESFSKPIDPYHIKVTALDIHRALELIDEFIAKEDATLFVYAGHSYDFYVDNTFSLLEELLKILNSHQDDIKVVTMKEMVNELF